MSSAQPFKWRHFQADIILLNVRCYLRYGLSYRDLEKMMLERGVEVDHTTIYRWVQTYSPELDKRCRPVLGSGLAPDGKILVLLTAKRDAKAAQRFLRKVLKASHTVEPRVITVDKNPSYPAALTDL